MMKYIAAVCAAILLFSCNKPVCTNNNPVFDQYRPEATEYKRELCKQLNAADRKKLTFWIERDSVIGGVDYMYIEIQGKNLCAHGIFDITNGRGLNNYRAVKGVGYKGGELKGFKYIIDTSGGDIRYLFDEVVWIAD